MRYGVSGSGALAVLTVSTATSGPSLDLVAANPALVASLLGQQAWALYQQALGALLALLPVLRAPGSPGAEAAALEDRLLTVAEVAARLGVRPSRVRELTRTGAMPSVKIGKYVRIRPGALAAWLAEHEKKPLYSALSTAYNQGYDRSGASANPQKPRADAGRARQATRAPLEQRSPAGARRATNPGAGRKARPDDRGRRPPPAPPDPDQDETQW